MAKKETALVAKCNVLINGKSFKEGEEITGCNPESVKKAQENGMVGPVGQAAQEPESDKPAK